MPYEIGFPVILTSGAFLNHTSNKQTSHELHKNLAAVFILYIQWKKTEDKSDFP